MTLDQFITDNIWGLLVGGVGLAFTVGTVYMAVRMSLREVTSKISDLSEDMKAKDAVHDALLTEHGSRIVKLETDQAVINSRLDQTIKHIGEQLARIYDKLFKD